ncbi:serpin family protein [Streptomyces sp. TLI_171]|uniref:serpin family protein n=1 Tax=Streptomyces sp. TLI_171 TaxID=1938859 RepID=UPI000C57D8DD|nr:serpin family protein [Streptomyces sp. TLI_171]RKE18171.1 serine protease inhibitor [Streptomyces sp. TLI_171]
MGLSDAQFERRGGSGVRSAASAPVPAVDLVNALGARWGRALAFGAGQVWTALGVWPLLAALGAGTHDPAVRAELAAALGVPVEQAPALARELLARVRQVPGCGAALGLWTADGLGAEAAWVEQLGPVRWGALTGDPIKDRAALDRWADEETGGLIPTMPLESLDKVLLVLASALTVRTKWERRFVDHRAVGREGPWAGRELPLLTATGAALYERFAVAESSVGPVTEVRVAGAGEVDVHLVLGGPEAGPGAVVAAGFELVSGAARRVPMAGLADGAAGWPGLVVESVDSAAPHDTGELTTVGFRVAASHDLLGTAGLFGLRTASGPGEYFRGISRDTPLRVSAARQSATAEFSAEGFEGGAVTVVAMRRGGAAFRPPQFRVRRAAARFDRPFAFLAVHRASGLVLLAGWVAEPGG